MGSGSSPGGQPTPGKPIGLEGGAPALSGLVGQPKKGPMRIGRKIKEKEKKRRRWEGKTLYQKKIFVSTQEVKQIILP